jgi:hypothetical protein
MRSKKALIGIGIGLVVFAIGVFFWAKQPSSPFPIYQVRCRMAGGEPGIVKVYSPLIDSDSSLPVCKAKKVFSDVGKKCETDNDCMGMCESVMDDVYYPRSCTDRMY